jgi:hypothetical protein
MLMIATLAIQTSALHADDKLNNQQKIDFGSHQPGDIREGFDLSWTESHSRLYPIQQVESVVSINKDIIELIEQINETMINSYIENLISFGPRVTATKSCDDAGKYLYQEFKDMGLSVRYQNWSYSQTFYGSTIEATLPGSNPESDCIFIVHAHYDTTPGSVGADDDASGIAAVLAAAQIMNNYSFFNHTIRFVAFSGEEQGLFGSYYYAEEAYGNGDHIIGALNADAIAYATNDINASKVDVYQNDDSVWLTNHTANIAQMYSDEINLEIVPCDYMWGSSDQARFWQFGYDAIWYFENEPSPYLNTPHDDLEYCNITYITRVSRLILATLADLALSYKGEIPIDIPVWEKGDEWVYHMDFYCDFGMADNEILEGTSNNLVYKVIDDSGDDYVLKYKGGFSGWIKTSFATIRITRLSVVKGNLLVQKSNLAIKEYSIEIKGISLLTNGNIPIPVPIPVQIGLSVDLSPALHIMPFPLYDGKYGNLSESWLNHSAFISLMFGLLFEFQKDYDAHAYNFPYRCEKDLVKVPAGTYDTYKISVGTFAKIENNFAPEVGNIVKQRIWVGRHYFPEEPYFVMNQELLSTTYEP